MVPYEIENIQGETCVYVCPIEQFNISYSLHFHCLIYVKEQHKRNVL